MTITTGSCVFCAVVAGDSPATVVRRWPHALAIVPINPVTPGHLLVIPHQHVSDVGADSWVTAGTMAAASELAAEHEHCNVITSRGAIATQTVFHLHVHVVPRRMSDGLALPWTGQRCA